MTLKGLAHHPYGRVCGAHGCAATKRNTDRQVHRLGRGRLLATLAHVLAVGSSYEAEFRIVRSNGEVRWVRGKGAVLCDKEQRAVRMLGVNVDIADNVDITDRKLTEEAARMEEERFSQIFRLSPDAMMISRDVEGCILDVNNRWEKLFQFRRDDVVGKAVRELNLYASNKDRCAVLEHATCGEARDLELQMRDTSGSILQVMLSGVAITIGKDSCFITIIRDVSELRRAEQQAQEQRAQLTHLARVALLGKLSGALAHELNQPLTAILSNAQAAQRELTKIQPDLDEIRQILQDIAEEDKRAGEVIRRLRALFRKEAPEMQPLNLNEVIKETLGIARTDLITRKVVAETSLKPGLTMVFGDRVQLQQVLLNLILNACEAMSGNTSEQQHFHISTDEVPGNVQLSVSDTGHGIASNAMEHLFDAFFTTKPHGLGFGLSISLSIVAEHGGRIEAMNNPVAGATFRVSLPAYTGTGDN